MGISDLIAGFIRDALDDADGQPFLGGRRGHLIAAGAGTYYNKVKCHFSYVSECSLVHENSEFSESSENSEFL